MPASSGGIHTVGAASVARAARVRSAAAVARTDTAISAAIVTSVTDRIDGVVTAT